MSGKSVLEPDICRSERQGLSAWDLLGLKTLPCLGSPKKTLLLYSMHPETLALFPPDKVLSIAVEHGPTGALYVRDTEA